MAYLFGEKVAADVPHQEWCSRPGRKLERLTRSEAKAKIQESLGAKVTDRFPKTDLPLQVVTLLGKAS